MVPGVQVDVLPAGSGRIKRVIDQPGFHWSTHMKQAVGTDGCLHAHIGFIALGRIAVSYANGGTLEFAAPRVMVIEPGHDGWWSATSPPS